MFDHDRIGKNDPLGDVVIPITDIVTSDFRNKDGGVEIVARPYVLRHVKHGSVMLNITLRAPKNSTHAIINAGTLIVTAHSASKLMAKDMSGASDPYMVLKVGGKEYRTTCVKKTLEPEWNEEFRFRVTDAMSQSLHIKIFDWDAVGKDDLLGERRIPLIDIADVETREKNGEAIVARETYDLRHAKHGSATLSFHMKPKSDYPILERAEVSVTVHSARDLISADALSKSNPFCECKIGASTVRTKVVKKTLSPTWEEKFDLRSNHTAKDMLQITVLDWNRVGATDPLGHVSIPINEIVRDDDRRDDGTASVTQLYQLKGVKSGYIKLTVTVTPAPRRSTNPILPRGLLTVMLHRAEELVAADTVSRTSDPFAKLILSNQTAKSRTLRKTLTPVWDQPFEFAVLNTNRETLQLRMFDWDRVGKNDPLGDIEIPISEIAEHDSRGVDGTVTVKQQRYQLQHTESGAIHLSFHLKPMPVVSEWDDLNGSEVNITVHDVRNVSHDPKHLNVSCEVRMSDENNLDERLLSDKKTTRKAISDGTASNTTMTMAETVRVKHTPHPSFDEAFQFVIQAAHLDQLRVRVLNHDGVIKKKLETLGDLSLSISQLVFDAKAQHGDQAISSVDPVTKSTVWRRMHFQKRYKLQNADGDASVLLSIDIRPPFSETQLPTNRHPVLAACLMAVTVHRAQDLLQKNRCFNGSDGFVVLDVSGQTHKTHFTCTKFRTEVYI
jgi:Ca2+-dependent lipid-binding protein